MSLTDDMELVETTYNVYDAQEHFRDNFSTEALARRHCPPGGRVVERNRYERYEDGNTVYTREPDETPEKTAAAGTAAGATANDVRDAEITRARLNEIARDPDAVVRAAELKRRLAELV